MPLKKMNSYIQINKSGTETLIVFYNNLKADYDVQTEIALKRHGLSESSKINFLCLPKRVTRPKRGLDIKGVTGGAHDK